MARNPNTPPEVITDLAHNQKNWLVRLAAAGSPNISVEDLYALLEDDRFDVRSAAEIRLRELGEIE